MAKFFKRKLILYIYIYIHALKYIYLFITFAEGRREGESARTEPETKGTKHVNLRILPPFSRLLLLKVSIRPNSQRLHPIYIYDQICTASWHPLPRCHLCPPRTITFFFCQKKPIGFVCRHLHVYYIPLQLGGDITLCAYACAIKPARWMNYYPLQIIIMLTLSMQYKKILASNYWIVEYMIKVIIDYIYIFFY